MSLVGCGGLADNGDWLSTAAFGVSLVHAERCCAAGWGRMMLFGNKPHQGWGEAVPQTIPELSRVGTELGTSRYSPGDGRCPLWPCQQLNSSCHWDTLLSLSVGHQQQSYAVQQSNAPAEIWLWSHHGENTKTQNFLACEVPLLNRRTEKQQAILALLRSSSTEQSCDILQFRPASESKIPVFTGISLIGYRWRLLFCFGDVFHLKKKILKKE